MFTKQFMQALLMAAISAFFAALFRWLFGL